MEEPRRGDLVFHCILEKAYQKRDATPNSILAYSTVANSFYIEDKQDPLCVYPPPYRVITLNKHSNLSTPVTIEMLKPYREELELMSKESGFSRTPFDKNFNIKQLYLSRMPFAYLTVLSRLSKTKINVD